MNYLRQIQRGVDFIEANLADNLALGRIAKEAGMSQWHFQRMFRALTGETLKTYIRTRRLGQALDALLNTDHKILDIALQAGFETQESFTRAFKKAFLVTPARYREVGKRQHILTKVKFDLTYLKHIHKGMSMEPIIYEQKKMFLVGLRTTFYGIDSEKNNVGEKLPTLWQEFMQRISEITYATGSICYGVVKQLQEDDDELEYYCAIQVTSVEQIPSGMVSIEIPANTYAKFMHRGSVANIDNTVNYIYSTWLSQSHKRYTGDADLEFYGAEFDPTSEESVMYYAIPIQPNEDAQTED